MKIDVNDIVGQKFGKLTVLSFSHKKPHKTGTGFTYYYLCRCECGTEKLYDRGSLRRTRGTVSCGCICKGVDIIGKKFGKLTVLKEEKRTPRYRNGILRGHRIYYLCQCECGNQIVTQRDCLLRGNTKSCGCLKHIAPKEKFTTHGLTKTRLYNIFHKMRARCLKPNCKQYKDYGARGITICPEWKNSFLTFYEWSMNNGYADNLSLDRIDVNGNYEPSNCRWANRRTQNNNRRSNFYITIYNRTQTLSEWCDEKELDYDLIYSRINSGWSIEDAFTKE